MTPPANLLNVCLRWLVPCNARGAFYAAQIPYVCLRVIWDHCLARPGFPISTEILSILESLFERL